MREPLTSKPETNQKSLTSIAIAVVMFVAFAGGLQAQDVRRPQASRAELQAALTQLEQIISSPGYSSAIKKAKEAEANLVKQRLAEGDFQPGDQIEMVVAGEQNLSGKFTVLADRMLTFPMIPSISLKGVLRSEASDFLTKEIGRYVKNPQVVVQASYMRIAVSGSVNKPGYYSLPSETAMTDAIMAAGGPVIGTNMAKSIIRRGSRDVLTQDQVQTALATGQSLDELNLHSGDELVVGGSKTPTAPGGGGFLKWFIPVQALLGIAVLVVQVTK